MERPPRKKSIRKQLTLIIMALIMVPLGIMFFANRYFIQSRLMRQTRDTYATALSQTSRYVADRVSLARNLVVMLFSDSHIQQGYDFFKSSESNEETAWLADLSSGRVTYKGSLLGSLSRVYLYRNGASHDFRADRLYKALDDDARQRFEAWYADRSESFIFQTLPDDAGILSRYVYLIAKIPSATRLGSTLGLMQAELSVASFERILDSAPSSSHSALYLISGEGDAFIHTGDSLLDGVALAEFSGLLDRREDDVDAMTTVSYDGATYMAGLADIPGTDWRLLMVVPARDVTTITRDADRILLITMLILLLVILPIAALMTHSILKPVFRLQEGVEAVSQGDYNVTVPPSGVMELDQVIDSFNAMSRQTQRMMDEQYRMGQDLKNKELRLLQEQINPHFLYNTLDLLHWEARQAGNAEMEEITLALSQFYKLSLGHGAARGQG